MWESHSDSNRAPTVDYDSEVGSQPSDSRTWERRKVLMDMERRELDAGNRKNDSGLGTAVDRWCQLTGEEAREREREREIEHRPGDRHVFWVETMATRSTEAHKRARFSFNY